ncbi:MAG: sensor histidine kinase [Lachnospiraceae bacterium]
MVENLLSITRVGGENTSIQKSPEPAEEVVADAVRKFRRLYPDINVQAELPEDVLFVPMDAVLICQVFTNLLENATLHGGGTRNITVSAEVRGRSACFCVEDDGAGISENALPYLFEDRPSLRSAPADSGGRHNMGIGLSACRAIVKAHGGTMEAQNVPGRGARFCFTLPLDE